MNSYILIGMPSSGKTTKGIAISRVLDLKFIDTDSIIQDVSGMSPSEIVKSKGRDEFLSLQDDIISTYQFNDTVVATGGGIVYSKKAMDNLKKQGILIYLNVPYGVLYKRVDASRTFSGEKGKSFKELYDERQPLYKSFADIEIVCDNKEADEIINEILQKIKRRIDDDR